MVIKSYGAKRAYIKSCTYFLLKSLSHFGVTFTLNYIYAIGRLSVSLYFPKSKAIRGSHCYLCHTELHDKTHRKVFGGVHTGQVLALKTGELNRCVYTFPYMVANIHARSTGDAFPAPEFI